MKEISVVPDLRKAAEQALEALQDTCDHLPSRSGVEREVDDAITALQVALAHPEQEPVIDCPRCGHCCPEREWVGLTDKERADWHAMGLVGVELVAAHLEEKNT